MKISKTNRKYLTGAIALLLFCLLIGFWPSSTPNIDLPKTVDFNYHIRPLLSQNCFVCHGPDSSSREAGLRLDNLEGATALLESGNYAIVPGDADAGSIIERLRSENPEMRMPPPEAKKIMSEREIALLEKWIDQGAEWKPHWAFISPEMPDLARNIKEEAPSRQIDYLLDEELARRGLKKSEKASKNAIIRRASYILTGLPPSPDNVEAFLLDSSEQAFEKVVDQYLASPHFGERWARHWMDLVRYGEAMGHEFDIEISHAWEYRDYLIRAFNADVPFDLFVKEHLAGDMLKEARYHPTEGYNESIFGTGYFYLGEGKHSPVDTKQEEADKIDNMIDVTSKTFQALTVACARCHDHKFDPIPTTDYYAMYGMIESARLGPHPARSGKEKLRTFSKLKEVKQLIRAELAKDWGIALEEMSEESVFQLARFFEEGEKEEVRPVRDKTADGYQVIADFRKGSWDGWYSSGFAFGERPLMGEPVFDSKSGALKAMQNGYASSRAYGTGVHGILRSPNFILEHDSIAIRAAGKGGQIRLVVDNFQVIRNPLYGNLEITLDDEAFKTYYIDLDLVKGKKAYFQFTPGNYNVHGSNVYHQDRETYVEVEYASQFTGGEPEMEMPEMEAKENVKLADEKKILAKWIENDLSLQDFAQLNKIIDKTARSGPGPKLNQLLELRDSLQTALYDSTHFIGMAEGDAVFSSVFIRGSINQQSEEKVPRQFLSAVPARTKEFPQTGSGRLAWAEAVMDEGNPLTARVIVNRLWHHVFGRGIVESVDNFGLQGKLPSHPELLDYLAVKMKEEGWSIKRMLKHMLLTEAFQRSTVAVPESQQKDPTDVYLHHFPIRRLEGEAIRDGMLAVSDCMDSTLYGEPIPLHLTPFMTGRGKPRISGPLDGMGRRSVYTAIRRNFLSPMMLVFDAPIPFSTFGKRLTTNVPAQSLTLLNDPFVQDQAYNFALNLLTNGPEKIEDRIAFIYSRAFSRQASEEEIKNGIAFLQMQAKDHLCSLEDMKNDTRLWADYCHTIFNLKEFIHLL
ncbi:MAG: PSD1 and planctomycete cytochrome C domain-containing protein [Bacteroidia bacterium]|nr:PSD1 and planctomycete cytochrome C domain-containing protein [Bacteroidia bacterium]